MNDEKIKELLSDPSSRNLGLLLLAQTMGDPVRDYEVLSSCRKPDLAVTLFAAIYGTRLIRTPYDWGEIKNKLPSLKVLSLVQFTKKFTYHPVTNNTVSQREVLLYELGPELDCHEDMIASNPPKFLAHLFE